MPRHPMLRLAAVAISVSLCAYGAQAQPADPVQKQAVSALSSFAIAYGAWTWEERCKRLSPNKHAAFQRQVAAELTRLRAIFEPRVVAAAVAAGTKQANDPKMQACDGEYADFADFGVSMAADADKALGQVPDGYKITITP